jgi:tetratricopeptide (TPR) repeat protein
MYERRKAIRFEPEELARASRDLDNVRAALLHAIDSAESALAQKAFAGGAIVWLLHGSLVEGDTWATRTLFLHSEETVLLGFATGIAAEFPRFMGDLDRALELKRRALAVLGNMALDPEGERMLAAINTDVSDVMSLLGRFREAESYATQGLAIRKAIGDPAGIAHALEALANVEARSGRSAEALVKLEQAVGLWKRGGRHHEAAQTLSNIAYTKRSLGDLAGARQTIDEALAYLPRTHSHIYLTWANAAAGLIALDEAHFDECTRLLSEAREQARLAKLSLDIAGEIEEALARCREELGEDRFEEAQAAGIAAAIGPTIESGDA